jgi:hypothetical protein
VHDARAATLTDRLHADVDVLLQADLAALDTEALLRELRDLYRAEARLAAPAPGSSPKPSAARRTRSRVPST